MKFEGYLEKEKGEKFWGVEIPVFGVFTQGKTKQEAYSMAKDALEELVNKEDFTVKIEQGQDRTFYISANQTKYLIALLLRQKRLEKGLTIIEVAERLGSKSPTAYARYESGTNKPSFEKLDQILRAMDENLEPILKIGS